MMAHNDDSGDSNMGNIDREEVDSVQPPSGSPWSPTRRTSTTIACGSDQRLTRDIFFFLMGCNTRDKQEDGDDLRAGQGAPEQVHPDVAGQEPEQHHETRLPQVLRGRRGADGDPELDTAQPDQVFAGDDSV